ncbi:MAG: hypothetical protein IE909_16245 [Campylobacterales bacterium]|nr:hypothetical protein [Campylobacterales bacterium]
MIKGYNEKKRFIMPRKPRVEKAGFYYIINSGVARANIYLCDDDFLRFLELI